ncbi:Amino acid/polyamine transporter [Trema orientale]|uniref:Amino acid/polyamine transporter n=1 Tax=Trema orientale TaxID=63057 RepID=A0A2P5EB48_TREOI|nr:Amino acid/polyamine transporter [Trema orientale]
MAFYGEKMNLNSYDDNLISDDGFNNENYDTMSQLMRTEKDDIAREKQKLQVLIPERVEANVPESENTVIDSSFPSSSAGSTGTIKEKGPAVVLSYVVSGISTMLSVFYYTEFAVEIPVAG